MAKKNENEQREKHKEYMRNFREQMKEMGKKLLGDDYQKVAEEVVRKLKPLEKKLHCIVQNSNNPEPSSNLQNTTIIPISDLEYVLGSYNNTGSTTGAGDNFQYVPSVDRLITMLKDPSTENQEYIIDILTSGVLSSQSIQDFYVKMLADTTLPQKVRQIIGGYIVNNNLLPVNNLKIIENDLKEDLPNNTTNHNHQTTTNPRVLQVTVRGRNLPDEFIQEVGESSYASNDSITTNEQKNIDEVTDELLFLVSISNKTSEDKEDIIKLLKQNGLTKEVLNLILEIIAEQDSSDKDFIETIRNLIRNDEDQNINQQAITTQKIFDKPMPNNFVGDMLMDLSAECAEEENQQVILNFLGNKNIILPQELWAVLLAIVKAQQHQNPSKISEDFVTKVTERVLIRLLENPDNVDSQKIIDILSGIHIDKNLHDIIKHKIDQMLEEYDYNESSLGEIKVFLSNKYGPNKIVEANNTTSNTKNNENEIQIIKEQVASTTEQTQEAAIDSVNNNDIEIVKEPIATTTEQTQEEITTDNNASVTPLNFDELLKLLATDCDNLNEEEITNILSGSHTLTREQHSTIQNRILELYFGCGENAEKQSFISDIVYTSLKEMYIVGENDIINDH